ncbi:MAG TPA: TonB-dependent receptor [Bryobacteraceae bacterium]|nr:TonB-dependent receptor [Bryobacteraceae bacterium]
MRGCLAVFLGICVASVIWAQSDRGSITGTVADASNAVVPAANVSATNLETGAQYQTATTSTGNYTLSSLPVGTYSLSVDVPGFKKLTRSGIQVMVAQSVRVDLQLQVGTATEAVTVTADAALLKTESAEHSFVISNQRVDQLPLPPLYVRNPLNWASLVPGVVGNTNGPAGSSTIRVNGSPATTYKVLVDGQDITSSIDPSHTLEQQPSVEAIQEFTLQSSNFAAEFGQVQGGLFNFTSKSGTNELHGSAYSYFRNEGLNASTPFAHLRPKSRAFDWGFTVGGPIIIPKVYNGRNKTFFFFNWERYQTQSQAANFITVPTDAIRSGDFSSILTNRVLGTDIAGRSILENTIYDPTTARSFNGQTITDPFPNNIIPKSLLDPISLKIQSLIPEPTLNAQVNNYRQSCVTPEHRDLPTFKIDQNFGTKSKLSFYWSEYDYESMGNPDCLPQPISGVKTRSIPTHTYRLTYDYTVTPTFLIHAGAGFNHYYSKQYPVSLVNGYDSVSQLGLVGANGPGFPAITFGSATYGGESASIGGVNGGDIQISDKPTGVLSGTLVRGNHTYKTGAEFRIDTWIDQGIAGTMGTWGFNNNETALPYLATGTVSGGSIGYGYASFLLGRADSASVQPTRAPQLRKNSWALYIQDTWKVTRKLTLDYGLRWDYQAPYHETHNRIGAFGPNVPNPSAGGLLGGMQYAGNGPGQCNCALAYAYPYAIGPRLGIAWQVLPKTVVRGGWGIVYGTTPSSSYFSSANGVGWNTFSLSSTSFAQPAATFAQGLNYSQADLVGPLYSPGLYPAAGQISPVPLWIDPNGGRPPRVVQWSIGIQHQLSEDLLLEAAYVGNRSVWDQATSLIDINALTPQKITSVGLNLNSTADQNLLKSTFASGLPQARGFQVPYAGFPTGLTLAQALRPFPQFGTISARWSPLGDTWYDSLQAKLTKRTKHGLTVSSSFTWSKNLVLGAETGTGGGDPVNDVFNRPNQKTISNADQPFVFTNAINYRLPQIGPNAIVRHIVGGWSAAGILSYASGLPIAVPAAQNNLSLLLFRGTFANRVAGQPLYTKDPNCGCIDPNKDFALNPAAWSDPAPGQWGTSAPYYSDYRAPRRPSESLSLGRVFHLGERVSMEVRAEFINAFNRVYLPAPTSTNALATQSRNPTTGAPTAGFGYINANSIGGQRTGQLLARFQW